MDGDMIHRTPTAPPQTGCIQLGCGKGVIDTVVDKRFCKRQQTLPRHPQPDCPTLFGAPLTTLYRPYFLPEFFPGLEEGHLLGGDLDRIAGFGIAPFAGIAAPGSKTAKTSQLDFVALPQGLGNTREQNADDGFGLPLGKVDSVGNSSSEL